MVEKSPKFLTEVFVHLKKRLQRRGFSKWLSSYEELSYRVEKDSFSNLDATTNRQESMHSSINNFLGDRKMSFKYMVPRLKTYMTTHYHEISTWRRGEGSSKRQRRETIFNHNNMARFIRFRGQLEEKSRGAKKSEKYNRNLVSRALTELTNIFCDK